MENLSNQLDIKSLYQRNGIGQYSFNTLFKLHWLKNTQARCFPKKWLNSFLFRQCSLNA